MGDEAWKALAIIVPSVVASLVGLIMFLQINRLKKTVNGKMSELLEVTAKKEKAEGKLEGKEEQKQEDKK